MKNLSACVFCGASPGKSDAYVADARALGRLMAEAKIDLVYGGASVGLMGAVAEACLQGRGRVTGVIPEFLRALERPTLELSELIITADMHERKMKMWERADGFIVLPGGVGTLEELLEQLTWAQLGQHSKPIILLNTKGYWTLLEAFFGHMRATGFLREDLNITYSVVATAAEAVQLFKKKLSTAKVVSDN